MATVIKKGQQAKLLHRLVSFDLADHLAEAHQVVAAARQEAARIVEEARLEGRRIEEEARQRGHQQGYQRGFAQGRTEGQDRAFAEATQRFDRDHADLAASMAAVIDAFEQQKRDLLIAANRDLLEFAVVVARKVAHRVGRINRDAAVAVVEQALRLVGGKTDITIRANPADLEALQRFAARRAEEFGDRAHVTLLEDDSIAPGGAVVTCGPMEIDARLETQLEQITTLLLGSEALEVRSEKGSSELRIES